MRALKSSSSLHVFSFSLIARPSLFLETSRPSSDLAKNNLKSFLLVTFRSFCSHLLILEDDFQGLFVINYRFVLFVNFSDLYYLRFVWLLRIRTKTKEKFDRKKKIWIKWLSEG